MIFRKNDHIFIFIHVPKTGGRAVAAAIKGAGYIQLHYKSYHGHDRIIEYKDFDYPSMAFIRNPWDRLLSSYSYLYVGGTTDRDRSFCKRVVSKYPTFKHFVCDYVAIGAVDYVHLKPQTHWISDGNIIKIKYVGKFPYFKDALREFIGLDVNIDHINQSKHGNYKSMYDHEMIDIVSEIYSDDIKMLGFSFDG